ncbi:TIGR04283 family arsenosugar biosynthesis glycosyltransferase [Rubripirellula reticaptiva]|uniref:Glycosyl transferase family 2 n=1 Tax=Rubripirellula reticaptiva TaxID=2528013 RepID=A0A5C6F3X4_9BACT|nr:TIGR04283 family arsenosugar biosynthesis glycosyltransferase [Rubripirellula reticaptiva]TWU55234.1 Glycosyl transferase family 2 [Rubripirellula reticaptiva]
MVIPTRNESANIAAAIRSAIAAGAAEVIVADAGSHDDTVEQATRAGAHKIVRSLPGRGTQQNSGAMMATANWLLFLHADNRLAPDCLVQISNHPKIQAKTAVWGAFQQHIDSPKRIYRAIEWGNAARVRWRSMAFGDQAIFVRRDVFKRIGGFDDIPLMEDVRISQKLRKQSKPLLLPGPLQISARRWEQNGPVRQTLINWRLQFAHATGTRPEELARRYESR